MAIVYEKGAEKRMNKHGDYELYFFAFMVIAAGIVVLIYANLQKNVEDSKVLDQKFLSRDIAMLLSAAYSSPGSILIEYGKGVETALSDFNYAFQGSKVDMGATGIYPYMQNNNFLLSAKKVSMPRKIYISNMISNKGYTLQVDGAQIEKNGLLRYPNMATKNSHWRSKKIVLDSNIKDASKRKALLGEGIGSPIKEDYDVYIYVEVDEKISSAKAFISPGTASNSRKLAAMILNELWRNNFEIEGIHLSDEPELAKAKETAVRIVTPSLFVMESVLEAYYG